MPTARLRRSFFERYTPTVAREILGARLVRVLDGIRLSGVVVETEAYRGRRDPASHAYRGKSHRNEVMFGEGGHAYVYFTMGVHHCLNVTTEATGSPAAVLIRALKPIEGIEAMRRMRRVAETRRLTTGPGNLAKALGIDLRQNGEDMVKSHSLFFEEGTLPIGIGTSPRVGVSSGAFRAWRFYVKGSPFVSKGRPLSRPQNP